jgi:hypothetical protein
MAWRALISILYCLLIVSSCSGARFENQKGPALAFPANFTRGASEQKDAGADAANADAAADAPAPELSEEDRRRIYGSLPDPTPLRLREQWEYDVVYDKGKVAVLKARLRRFERPVVTARQMGRYAIELWIGRELIDRVRFDFPMLGAEEVPSSGRRRPLHEPPTLAAGAHVTRRVLVPASPRATRALLVDRGTGEEISLPWPPK